MQDLGKGDVDRGGDRVLRTKESLWYHSKCTKAKKATSFIGEQF